MSFVKQKTAYERRISDWSSDVCSSDLTQASAQQQAARPTTQSLTPSRLAPGEENAVREAIRPCWNVDPAAIDVPAVKVRITMNADGTVQSDRQRRVSGKIVSVRLAPGGRRII